MSMNAELYLLAIALLAWGANAESYKRCDGEKVSCLYKCIPLRWICDGGTGCDYGLDEENCPNKLRTLSGIFKSNAREHTVKALSWLRKQRRPFNGWGRNTSKAVITLSLTSPKYFNINELDNEVIVKDLQFELVERIRRSRNENKSIPMDEMALYLHALLASCINQEDFFGVNIIKMLENELKSAKPFHSLAALALCNSNHRLPLSVILEIVKILERESKPEWIDQQAYALMTLKCLYDGSKMDLDKVIKELKLGSYDNIRSLVEKKFLNLQSKNGNFGDIYTTALVIQALIASENSPHAYDSKKLSIFSAALDFISERVLNNPHEDIVSTYLLLPLLNGKTALDLGTLNCSSSPLAGVSVTEPPDTGVKNPRIWYSIWIGDAVEEVYGLSVLFPINSSFYDIMVLAADMHKKYRFEYVEFPNGKYITLMAGIKNNAEARKYWYLFELENNVTKYIYTYPDKVFPKHNDHLAYWYRSTIIDSKIWNLTVGY